MTFKNSSNNAFAPSLTHAGRGLLVVQNRGDGRTAFARTPELLNLKDDLILLRILNEFALKESKPVWNGSRAHNLWIFCLGLAAIVIVPQRQPARIECLFDGGLYEASLAFYLA